MKVSILTNIMVRTPFQGLVFQILVIFALKSKMAAILHIVICWSQGLPANNRNIGNFHLQKNM